MPEKRRRINPDTMWQALDLHRKGHTKEEIAGKLSIGYLTVYRIVDCYEDYKAGNWQRASERIVSRFYPHYIFNFISVCYVPSQEDKLLKELED